MEFGNLRELLPSALKEEVELLLTRKATADEKTTVPRPDALVTFLQTEYAAALSAREMLSVARRADPTPLLDALFRQWL